MKTMNHFYTLVILILCQIHSVSWSQDRFTEDFGPIRKDLTSWDPIRGEWLASSLEAMSRNEPIPDRTFPEDFTPAEMLRIAPSSSRENINSVVQQRIANSDPQFQPQWRRMQKVVTASSGCRPITGRSFGDPHLVSFDGASYSFQTVGEFTLAKSQSGTFEVQTRQKPQSESFSLNTAVAMNVAGDRVCIYAEDHPGARIDQPLTLNGAPLNVGNFTYFLPHGGTIRQTGQQYLITWPTGETASAEIRRSGSMRFINMTVNVYPCSDAYYGLLGNANGRENDDFGTQGGRTPAMMAFSTFGNDQLQRGSNIAEKEYLAFLARDFAREHRIAQDASLFDYAPGQNTLSYTDLSFPRVHHTVGDLTDDRRESARRICEQNGVNAAEMRGCIFDQAYVNLPPSPRPVVNDPTAGYKPTRLEKPTLNVNRPADPMPIKPGDPSLEKPQKGSIHPDLLKEDKPSVVKPAVNNQTADPAGASEGSQQSKPTINPTEVPIEKPAPALPKPVIPAPKPAPAPKPVPAPKPSIKPGKGFN
jgi:hypothetical protein